MYSSNTSPSPTRAAALISSLSPLKQPLLADDRPKVSKFDVGEAAAPKGISVAEAVYNVLNVYVGLGLLSKPYAIAEGGWLSVPTLAVLCAIANVTGKLIVRGFAKLPTSEQNYAGLGAKAFGAYGGALVSGVVTLEFFGALMVVLIFVWKNALLLAPWYLPDAIISVETVAVVLTAFATPTVWALDFGAMTGIGLLGVVASVLIVGVLLLVASCAALELAVSHTPPPPLTLPLVGSGFTVSVGIFILSLGGHAALPGVYASMAEPHKFDQMLDLSICAMCLIYVGVGLAGWLTYGWLKGEIVDVLVTTNMAKDASGGLVPLTLPGSVGERHMSLEATVMTLAVLAKSFTAISPVTAVLADLPERLLLGAPPLLDAADAQKRRHVFRQRALRTLLLWLVALCAYPCALSTHGLALVEAVTGAMCSMLASLALPCACWVALYKDEVPAVQSVAALALAVIAAVAGAAFTAADVVKLGTE